MQRDFLELQTKGISNPSITKENSASYAFPSFHVIDKFFNIRVSDVAIRIAKCISQLITVDSERSDNEIENSDFSNHFCDDLTNN